MSPTATAFLAPWIVPSSARGKDGAAAPSGRNTMGCIGIGGMGTYDLRNFLTNGDVRVLAVCGVHAGRRGQAKVLVDNHYQNQDCAASLRLLSITITSTITSTSTRVVRGVSLSLGMLR